MQALELVGTIATILGGIVAVLSLISLLRKHIAKSQRERLGSRRKHSGEVIPEGGDLSHLGAQTSYELGLHVPNLAQTVEIVKQLVSSSQYERAVSVGKETLDALDEMGRPDSPAG